MDAPKCRLCGKKHYGLCDGAPVTRTRVIEQEVIENIVTSAIAARKARAEAGGPTLAPPGTCPYCDARRAKTAEAVKQHRARKAAEKEE